MKGKKDFQNDEIDEPFGICSELTPNYIFYNKGAPHYKTGYSNKNTPL